MAEQREYFKIEKDGPIVIWRFHNPPKNLWDPGAWGAFVAVAEEFYSDPELRVGIFASAMPDVFIQHYDVSLLVKAGQSLREEKPTAPPPSMPRWPVAVWSWRWAWWYR